MTSEVMVAVCSALRTDELGRASSRPPWCTRSRRRLLARTHRAPGLEHRKMNDAVVNFTTRESFTSGALKFRPMFVKIAERLVLRPECRLKATHLPNRAYGQDKVIACPSHDLTSGTIRTVLDMRPPPQFVTERRLQLAGQTIAGFSRIVQSVSCASSLRLAEEHPTFSPRPLPSLPATREDAACFDGLRWLASPDPPSLARPLPAPNAAAWRVRDFQGKVRLVSCRSSPVRIGKQAMPAQSRDRAGNTAISVHP